MARRLALTIDGRMTWCTCEPGQEGKGRCNHIAHQAVGQSMEDFLAENEHKIAVEGGEPENGARKEEWGEYRYDMEWHAAQVTAMPDNTKLTAELVSQFGVQKDPDWNEIIRLLNNPFTIGSEIDGTYEEAKLLNVDKRLCQYESGDAYHLTLTYEFRGEEYAVDFGDVPVVDEFGCITINGGKWRPLPVLEQRKAGVVSYMENCVVQQADGNVAFTVPKGEGDCLRIRGALVPIDVVEKYYATGEIHWVDEDGETHELTSGQLWSLNHLDQAVLERFPDLKSDIRQLKSLPMDEVGDLSYRRVIRYEDMVSKQMAIQMRRMGVTFRTNLSKRQKALEDGSMTEEEIAERFPLFYQANLTENIKRDLIGRSNVQNAETLNPISALCQAQKLSLTGPGGFNKDKAPYELRMPHPTHEGLIDPLVASSGKNVGFTVCMNGGYVGKDRYVHKKGEGEETLSPSDFIPYKYHDDPSRANMACAHVTQACPITGGEDPLISTPAWDKIKGAKLGVNLKVAYLADKGAFEDSVVLLDTAAARMTTVQDQEYRCFDKGALAGLKPGQRIERKTNIGGAEVKFGGVVKSVSDEGFVIETAFPMTVGDKLSNRHGGKSVVSEIRKASEMPQIFNESTGQFEAADIIMTPIGVVGRKNLGQVMECNEAAAITGMHVPARGESPSDINRSSTVISAGHKVEATSGVEYVMRLNHIAEKSLASHADEVGRDRESEGTRLGEMERILLSTDSDRLKILRYLTHQQQRDAHNKLRSLLKSIGVDMTGVNW